MWSGWASWTSPRRATRRPASAVRLGNVVLRHGSVEIGWRLAPNGDPTSLQDVSLRAGPETHAAEVVARSPDGEDTPEGFFRVSLPGLNPPWTLGGQGPEGPWTEEVAATPQMFDDYRQAVPIAPSAASVAERQGVRVALDRVAASGHRFAVFYTVDVAAPGWRVRQVATPTLCVEDETWQAIPPPTRAEGTATDRPSVGVAYFPPQLAVGTRAQFEVPEVMLASVVALDLRLPLATPLPAVLEPDLDLPTGHRLHEVVVTQHGVLLRTAGGGQTGSLVVPRISTDHGRTLLSAGGSATGGSAVSLFGPVPPDTGELVLERALLLEDLPGPWRLRFAVPMPL